MKITLTELEQNPQLLTTAVEDLDNWYYFKFLAKN